MVIRYLDPWGSAAIGLRACLGIDLRIRGSDLGFWRPQKVG